MKTTRPARRRSIRKHSTKEGALPATWLAGTKVRLRPIEPADVRLLRRWLRTEAAQAAVRGLLPPSSRAELGWLARVSTDPSRPSFIVQTGRGEDIGLGMLWVKDAQAEMGFVMSDARHWRGYGLEAVRVFVDAAFRVLPLQRIEVRVAPGDEPILTTYVRAGFEREGVLRKTAWRHAGLGDQVLMSVLQAEWMGWRRATS